MLAVVNVKPIIYQLPTQQSVSTTSKNMVLVMDTPHALPHFYNNMPKHQWLWFWNCVLDLGFGFDGWLFCDNFHG